MLIYALQSYSSPALGSYTANQTYTVTDAIGNQLIQLGVAQNSGGPSFTAPVDVPLDQSGSPTGMVTKASTASGSAAVAAALGGAVLGETTGTEAGIRAAAAAVSLMGGGIVQLQPKTYTITSPLPYYNNVYYRGAKAHASMRNNTVDGGTILDCVTKAFNCFEYNPTDSGSLPANIGATEGIGGGVLDLGIRRAKYGIKYGALFNGGARDCVVDGVYVTECAQWGIWAENCHNIRWGTVVAYDCVVGGVAIVASGGAQWNYGNDTIDSVITQGTPTTSPLMRGLSIMSRGGSEINDVLVKHATCIGGNSGDSLDTQSVTYVANSPDIQVTDLSKFAVDVAITAGSSTGGIVTKNTYFVISKSGSTGAGTVQISAQMGGTVATPSAGGTLTWYIGGGQGIEVVGYGQGLGNTATYVRVLWSDIEVTGPCGYIVQNSVGGRYDLGRPGPAHAYRSNFTTRASDARNEANFPIGINAYDCDNPVFRFTGYKPSNRWNNRGVGQWYDGSTTNYSVNITGKRDKGDIYCDDPTFAYNPVMFGGPIKLLHAQISAGNTISGSSSSGQVLTYTGAAGSVGMPTLVDQLCGLPLFIFNAGTGTATFNTQSGQAVGLGGPTSFTVASGAVAMVMGHNSGGTFIWAKYI